MTLAVELLLEPNISEYCFSAAEERSQYLSLAEDRGERPVYILPTFELCRAVYFGATEFDLQPDLFRDCWEHLAASLWGYANAGYLVHVAPGPDEEHDLVKSFVLMSPASTAGIEAEADSDPRDRSATHFALTDRLRRLHQFTIDYLEDMDESYRGWACAPPESLPTLDTVVPLGDASLVLDANYCIELLNGLPTDGRWSGSLFLEDRIPAQITQRFQHLLETYGQAGKLIIPVSALEETTRVASLPKNRHKYQRCRDVLREMSLNQDMPLWNAFSIEPLSARVFNTFLGLFERLVEEELEPEYWPDFGDALVLAHGLSNGCPVASAEWVEKHDWDMVGELFPFLVLRPE